METEKTSVNLPPGLKDRFRLVCSQRRKTMSTGLGEAMEAWMAGGSDHTPVLVRNGADSITPAEWLSVSKLLSVLRSNNFSVVTGIQISLDAYAQVAEMRRHDGRLSNAEPSSAANADDDSHDGGGNKPSRKK